MVNVSVLPEDPYANIFKALNDPKEHKAQLQQLSDRHKLIRDSLDVLNKSKEEQTDRQKNLDLLSLTLERREKEVSAREKVTKTQSEENARQFHEFQVIRNELSNRSNELSTIEKSIADRENRSADRLSKAEGLSREAEKRMQEAQQLKSLYEDKLNKLKELV